MIRALWLLAVVITAAGTAIDVVLDWPDAYDLVADVAFMVLGIAAATTGAIVTRRARGNAVGPLLLALGVGSASRSPAGPTPRCPHLGRAAARRALGRLVRGLAGHAILWGVPPYLLLLFPDGHLLSPRWVPAAWFIGVGVARDRAARCSPPTSRASRTRSR